MWDPSFWSAFPVGTEAALASAEQYWQQLRDPERPQPPTVVQNQSDRLGSLDCDVIIVGGTLGVILGAILVQRGWKVVLWERGRVRGRTQEWNISRSELHVFLDLGLLPDLESIIASEYNPGRVHFLGGSPLWVRDVLNVGVDPVRLIEHCQRIFLAQGGQICEQTPFQEAVVHPDGVRVRSTNGAVVTGQLLIDAMGHRSPLVAQARQGQRPEGVCLVVGGCAQGIPQHTHGDLIVTLTPIARHCQYFWEAFPARDGRTTYLFTYVDGDPRRLSLADLFADYLRLLPDYQQVELEALNWQRLLFGCFPAYRQSPLAGLGDRVLFIGDSSGQQSPLSFGGFGAMCRHLSRLSTSIHRILQEQALDQGSLQQVQPYQPNLAVTWLFQQAMRVPLDQPRDPQQVNRLLAAVFTEMAALGEATVRPFLQDVIQLAPLLRTLGRVSQRHPGLVAQLIPQIGLGSLLPWLQDLSALASFTGLERWSRSQTPHTLAEELRFLQWRYGSGQDSTTPG
ncbi:MAG: lycopene cyclase family protein [Synechococcales cyanobacterium]